MHGWTDIDAENKYFAVTGHDANFGDRRLKYSKYHYRRTEFKRHLQQYGNPNMIYEYMVTAKHRRYKLYYTNLGNYYVFETKTRSGTKIQLVDSGRIETKDMEIYKSLIK